MWYCKIGSICDAKFFLQTLVIMRSRCLTRRNWCLFQSSKFLSKYKFASKTILSVKFKLIFFDTKAICYSTFSLTSWVYPQPLKRSNLFTSSNIAIISYLCCIFQWAFLISCYNQFLYISNSLTEHKIAWLSSNYSMIPTLIREREIRVIEQVSAKSGIG